jgi:hypothetical protein
MSSRDYVIGGLCLSLGCFIGLSIVRVPYIELNPEVDLVAVWNLLIVIILAFLIPNILTSKLDNKRCEKNLLINELDILCNDIKEINKILNSLHDQTPSRTQFTQILQVFKKARNHLTLISDRIALFNNSKTNQYKLDLDNQLTLYWESVTGDNGLNCKKFIVTSPFLWKQSTNYDKTSILIRQLKFTINGL